MGVRHLRSEEHFEHYVEAPGAEPAQQGSSVVGSSDPLRCEHDVGGILDSKTGADEVGREIVNVEIDDPGALCPKETGSHRRSVIRFGQSDHRHPIVGVADSGDDLSSGVRRSVFGDDDLEYLSQRLHRLDETGKGRVDEPRLIMDRDHCADGGSRRHRRVESRDGLFPVE